MKIHNSLAVANNVLNLLTIDPAVENFKAVIECYANGREQGYAIMYTDLNTWSVQGIIFAEARGSDQIVVYAGDYTLGKLTDQMYADKRLFMPEAYEEVKDYIVSLLLDAKLKDAKISKVL